MQRYYIEKRGYGEYPTDAIVQHLRLTGRVKYINEANKFYWSNQPRVITFNADKPTLEIVEQWLPDDLRVYPHWRKLA